MPGIIQRVWRITSCAAILFALSTQSHAAALTSVLLRWDPPTEGMEYIATYQVRWSPNADGSNGTLIDAGTVSELRIDDLPPTKTYFHVRAVDVLGQEGEWSANTSRSVKPAVPATMGGLTVIRVELAR